MVILIVMFILIFGYYYLSNYFFERFKLKWSSGWEFYVLLGFYGVKFVIRGIIFILVVFGFFYIVLVFLNVFIYLGFYY